MAICHTVQVAGSYEEDEDRAEEELSLLNVNAEIPPIFHKSIEDLNDVESVQEEIDFITTRQTVTFDHRYGSPQNGHPESRPFSETVMTKAFHERAHKRPLSLSNIQVQKATSSMSPEPLVKHVEFAKENPLLRKLQQQEYKRTVSHNVDDPTKPKEMSHRRTRSSIPFGMSKNLDSIDYWSFKIFSFQLPR